MNGMRDPFTVVGVVEDMRYRDLREPPPSVYWPLAQSQFPFAPTTFVIRASAPGVSLAPALRQAVANAASGVELTSAEPFEHYMDGPLAQPRLNALLLGLFAV